MKTQRAGTGNTETTHFPFGLTDSKGRQVGAYIMTYDATFEPTPEDACSWYNQAPGTYKALYVAAARDGLHYGASQSTRYFATDAERAAAIAKYLKEAKGRAIKKAPAQAGQ